MQIQKNSSHLEHKNEVNAFASPKGIKKLNSLMFSSHEKASGLSEFDAGDLEFNQNPSYMDDASSKQTSSIRRFTQHSRGKIEDGTSDGSYLIRLQRSEIESDGSS